MDSAKSTAPALLDHRVVLTVALSGAPPPGFVPCRRGAEPRERLYLTREAHTRLHQERWELEAPERLRVGPFTARRVEAWRISDWALGLAIVLRAPKQPTSPELRARVDTMRLTGPLWPGQALPVWRWQDRDLGPLGEVLAALVPDSSPREEDRRLRVLSYTCHRADPGPDERYALLAVDPPELTPPPPAVRDAELERFAWRRWEAAGTWWAFTHYSGMCVTVAGDAGPSEEFGALFEGIYLDLAGWVQTRVYLHDQLEGWNPRSGPLIPRFSEQDQGRALARLWVAAIAADRDPPPPRSR